MQGERTMIKLSWTIRIVTIVALIGLASLLVTRRAPVTRADTGRWTDNVVPYYIDPVVSEDHRHGINEALSIWQERTSIRFEEITQRELQSTVRRAYLHYIDRGNVYH